MTIKKDEIDLIDVYLGDVKYTLLKSEISTPCYQEFKRLMSRLIKNWVCSTYPDAINFNIKLFDFNGSDFDFYIKLKDLFLHKVEEEKNFSICFGDMVGELYDLSKEELDFFKLKFYSVLSYEHKIDQTRYFSTRRCDYTYLDIMRYNPLDKDTILYMYLEKPGTYNDLKKHYTVFYGMDDTKGERLGFRFSAVATEKNLKEEFDRYLELLIVEGKMINIIPPEFKLELTQKLKSHKLDSVFELLPSVGDVLRYYHYGILNSSILYFTENRYDFCGIYFFDKVNKGIVYIRYELTLMDSLNECYHISGMSSESIYKEQLEGLLDSIDFESLILKNRKNERVVYHTFEDSMGAIINNKIHIDESAIRNLFMERFKVTGIKTLSELIDDLNNTKIDTIRFENV